MRCACGTRSSGCLTHSSSRSSSSSSRSSGTVSTRIASSTATLSRVRPAAELSFAALPGADALCCLSENVLVDPETGHVTLIDMGLATPFSRTSAKLSTCCGSPAFHSPEIVLSLSRPAGEVHYWGPEVDAWCIALTILRCWTGRRYPVGTGHKALTVMRGRVEDVLGLVSHQVMNSEDAAKRAAERQLRETLRGLLDLDGERRMQVLQDFDVGDDVRESLERFQRPRECTSRPLA